MAQYGPGFNTTDPRSPYYGLPDLPDYQTVYDPLSMSLTPDLQKKLDGIQIDKSGLNKFRQEAMRKGPSQWATLAKGEQGAQSANARERGASEVAGQTAQAEADLSAHGGLSSGARERTAEGGAKNFLGMSQDVGRQENLNDLQIGVNDEQNRMQQLGMLPGMEIQAAQPEFQKAGMWEQAKQTDSQAVQAENERRNQYNQWLTQQRQQAWGTEMQAANQPRGKKG